MNWAKELILQLTDNLPKCGLLFCIKANQRVNYSSLFTLLNEWKGLNFEVLFVQSITLFPNKTKSFFLLKANEDELECECVCL